jgi:hypothetical protein
MLPAATAPLTTLLAPLQEDEEAAARRRRATREVAFQAAHRLRQELAHPAIVHFYAWRLQVGVGGWVCVCVGGGGQRRQGRVPLCVCAWQGAHFGREVGKAWASGSRSQACWPCGVDSFSRFS